MSNQLFVSAYTAEEAEIAEAIKFDVIIKGKGKVGDFFAQLLYPYVTESTNIGFLSHIVDEYEHVSGLTALVADNPYVTEDILFRLLKIGDANTILGAINNPNIPVEFIEKLFTAIENESFEKFSGLTIFVFVSSEKILEIISTHKSTPAHILWKLINEGKFSVIKNVVKNPSASPEMLTVLSKNVEEEIRWQVAVHPNTPPEVLTVLGDDECWRVGWGVAENLTTPPEVLTRLAKSSASSVRQAVAHNPSTPEDVLFELSGDKDWMVRENVIVNVNTTGEILFNMINSDSFDGSVVTEILLSETEYEPNLYAYLRYSAERDGVCVPGQQIPIEWLKQMYLN